jgi:hypothetical protein
MHEFPSHNAYGILDYSLAVSGDVFRWIIDFAPLDVLERVLSECVNLDARKRTNLRPNVARRETRTGGEITNIGVLRWILRGRGK